MCLLSIFCNLPQSALSQSSRTISCIVASTSPSITRSIYIGPTTFDSNAPCIPTTFQLAILSLHDMHNVGGESALPGFVLKTPYKEYPSLPLAAAPFSGGKGAELSLSVAMASSWKDARYRVDASPPCNGIPKDACERYA